MSACGEVVIIFGKIEENLKSVGRVWSGRVGNLALVVDGCSDDFVGGDSGVDGFVADGCLRGQERAEKEENCERACGSHFARAIDKRVFHEALLAKIRRNSQIIYQRVEGSSTTRLLRGVKRRWDWWLKG